MSALMLSASVQLCLGATCLDDIRSIMAELQSAAAANTVCSWGPQQCIDLSLVEACIQEQRYTRRSQRVSRFALNGVRYKAAMSLSFQVP